MSLHPSPHLQVPSRGFAHPSPIEHAISSSGSLSGASLMKVINFSIIWVSLPYALCELRLIQVQHPTVFPHISYYSLNAISKKLSARFRLTRDRKHWKFTVQRVVGRRSSKHLRKSPENSRTRTLRSALWLKRSN